MTTVMQADDTKRSLSTRALSREEVRQMNAYSAHPPVASCLITTRIFPVCSAPQFSMRESVFFSNLNQML